MLTVELNRKVRTVGEMIELMKKLPPETELEVAVDKGAGYYTCRSDFARIGLQYYGSFGKSATLSLLVGDGHSDFGRERVEEEAE